MSREFKIPTLSSLTEEIEQPEEIEQEPEVDFLAAERELIEIERRTILEKASREAEILVNMAREEAEEIKTKAYNEGRLLGEQEGYKLGVEEAEKASKIRYDAEFEQFRDNILNTIKEVSDEKEKLLELYLDDLKNISLAIGEKIVQTSLKSSLGVIEKMILVTVEKLKKVSWAKIYIGNKGANYDVQGDTEFLKKLSRLADNVKVVMIEEEIGTCIIETPEGIIDISIKTQLENIKEILNNARL